MAAGLGFKDFVTGEVLTAADVDGYLMQGIWVFASAAARDAAVTSPQEGNFAYLKDTNTTTYYTGSAWTNLDTTGMVNPMTTTGDTIYSSSGSTPARLAIGTTGQVLTVAGGVPTWSTSASGGMTLINTGGTALTGSAVTLSSIPQTYIDLQLVLTNPKANFGDEVKLRINGDSNTRYVLNMGSGVENTGSYSENKFRILYPPDQNTIIGLSVNFLPNYTNTTTYKMCHTLALNSSYLNAANWMGGFALGAYNQTSAITSLEISVNGTFTQGTAYLYGIK